MMMSFGSTQTSYSTVPNNGNEVIPKINKFNPYLPNDSDVDSAENRHKLMRGREKRIPFSWLF